MITTANRGPKSRRLCRRSLRRTLGAVLAGMAWLSGGMAARAKGAAMAVPRTETERLTPVLPERMYAAPGLEFNLYFDNVILTPHPETYRYSVRCDVGRVEGMHWTVIPGSRDVGEHPFVLSVRDPGGKLLGSARSLLCIAPASAGAGGKLRLLIVGDSLTHATVYPNELARLLSKPGNPRWTMLGTHHTRNALPGVVHEGYGGWTWERFLEHYEPHPDPKHRKHSSPFVFLDPRTGKPHLDIPEYIRRHCAGAPPNVATFLLGINDCFSVNPDDSAAVDARIDRVLARADALLAAFHRAAPHCLLGVCITPPPNARESGFEANYKGKYHRWGWKRIQFRLAERMLAHFRGREKERIVLIPTELDLDPVKGFPENNGVHPNAFGYRQIAGSLYAWLKWQLAAGRIR